MSVWEHIPSSSTTIKQLGKCVKSFFSELSHFANCDTPTIIQLIISKDKLGMGQKATMMKFIHLSS